jgi:acyl-CoA synthetase (AMP-forming)/AMP-acid ligase II
MSPRHILENSARKFEHRIALIEGDLALSFGELNRLTDDLAASLGNKGVATGSQVAVVEPNSISFVIWLLALFKAGCVVATIDPSHKKSTVSQLLDTGEIDYLVCQTPDKYLDEADWVLRDLDGGGTPLTLFQRKVPTAKTVFIGPSHVLHRFSSGSTGAAKHMLFDESQLADDYSHLVEKLELDEHDRFIAVAPFFHSYGCLGLLSAITVGATTVVNARFLPSQILNLCLEHQVTVYFATPAMLDLLGRSHFDLAKSRALAHMRYLICATGQLGDDIRSRFQERFQIPISVLYGSTETASAAIDLEYRADATCVGKPFPGVTIKIVDGDFSELGPNELGKVAIKSPSCCQGYAFCNDNFPSFNGFVLPGDKGYMDDAGRLFILGRDDIINVGGYKVDRTEISNFILKNFPASYVAIRTFDRNGQPALEAIVEGSEQELDSRKIIDICHKHLTHYKVPARVRIVSSLPRDSNGKVRITEI